MRRADQRLELEQLCRYITRPAIANERLKRNRAGQVVLQLKSPYKDVTTHIAARRVPRRVESIYSKRSEQPKTA